MAGSLDELTSALTDQHGHIKTLMETVAGSEESERVAAFSQLCRFLAAHEAAEEECIHCAVARDLPAVASIAEERVDEEDVAGKMIANLERLGADAAEFLTEQLRQAVVAHADAEEPQELPKLEGAVDETQLARMQHAFSRVPVLAVRDPRPGETFLARLQENRMEFKLSS